MPETWKNNRAQFSKRGFTSEDLAQVGSLEAIPAEGLYRVTDDFYCCAKECVHIHRGQMVQLGYNGSAIPILFVPFWNESELSFPKEGIRIDASNFQFLQNLEVASAPPGSGEKGLLLH